MEIRQGSTPESEICLNSADEIMGMLDLDDQKLAGKTILDIGSGPRTLETHVKEKGIDSKVVSYDISEEMLREKGLENDSAVVGDFREGLPFKDDSFDLIICVHGPLDGGPFSENVSHRFEATLKALKENGEIRVFDPYLFYGDMACLMYSTISSKESISPKGIDFLKLCPPDQTMELDDKGWPKPYSGGKFFWNQYYWSLPQAEQEQCYQALTDYFEEALSEKTPVTMNLFNSDPSSEIYKPSLIVRKKAKQS